MDSSQIICFSNKEVEFCFIDQNCPTMRNNIAWKHIGYFELVNYFEQCVVQRALICYKFSYYKIAIVHRTYPLLDITYYQIGAIAFYEFWNSLTLKKSVNWIKEGF
jgi:hypothetical protein